MQRRRCGTSPDRWAWGADFLRAVDVCLSEIQRSPERYPQVYRQTRKALLRRFPYAVYFVSTARGLRVVACMHAKRDPRALLWGLTVVADSAQFSTAISELAPPQYVGTALSLQTCLGFLLTLVSIRLYPAVVSVMGWPASFAFLAPGPFLGTLAMWRLRRLPESSKLAQGKR